MRAVQSSSIVLMVAMNTRSLDGLRSTLIHDLILRPMEISPCPSVKEC